MSLSLRSGSLETDSEAGVWVQVVFWDQYLQGGEEAGPARGRCWAASLNKSLGQLWDLWMDVALKGSLLPWNKCLVFARGLCPEREAQPWTSSALPLREMPLEGLSQEPSSATRPSLDALKRSTRHCPTVSSVYPSLSFHDCWPRAHLPFVHFDPLLPLPAPWFIYFFVFLTIYWGLIYIP